MQLASDPYDLERNHSALNKAAWALKKRHALPKGFLEGPTVLQFNATLDVGGTFYVQDGWQMKHEELRQALQDHFRAVFRNNGNSFPSCFQFQQPP